MHAAPYGASSLRICYAIASVSAFGSSDFGLRPSPPRMNVCAPFIRRPVGTSLAGHRPLPGRHRRLSLHAGRGHSARGLPDDQCHGASLPGADPATVASSLAAPLERRLAQIAGVTEITSVSTLGGCSVTIQFDLNRNVDGAERY